MPLLAENKLGVKIGSCYDTRPSAALSQISSVGA